MGAKVRRRSADMVEPAQRAANDQRISGAATLSTRASKELIVAFMGAVGCGLAGVVTECEEQLKKRGYHVIRIKLSKFIKQRMESRSVHISKEDASVHYLANQSGGNSLRETHGFEVLAQYAVDQIMRHRISLNTTFADLAAEPPRVAYLIDQIKHPEEVRLLRMVYRNLFYLIGVMSTQEHRTSRLTDEGLTIAQIETVIHRDRKEPVPHGQQLEKTFKLADYFMHNPLGEEKLIPSQVKRFFDLVHGHNGTTPTKHEHAMYVAHATAMKSSCMSRQVGAVITDKSDRIIAVGTNDVPQYGGGLYTGEGEVDDRCFKHRKICENDTEKARRKDRIRAGIIKELATIFDSSELQAAAMEKIDDLVDLVFTQSGIPDLIEFSRAVHAEMDALIALSRSGGGSTVGGNLYTTTFPCHNCARHIIAAGLEKVYYIEPYEKSLAPEAHNDSIEVLAHDHGATAQVEPIRKVKFVHFSGVGPRLYPQLFLRNDGRKDDSGKFMEYSVSSADQPPRIIKEYIDSYRSFEAKIALMFDKEFPADAVRSLDG